jgi:FkbM family methyltransferase
MADLAVDRGRNGLRGRSLRCLRRVKHRTITPVAIIGATVAYIIRHPSNRGRRIHVLAQSVTAWIWWRLTRKPVLARLGNSSVALVQAQPLSVGDSEVLYGNPPDYRETSLLRRVLRPGDLFVDIGANAGVYSLLAAELGADVLALEPGSAARQLLERNIRVNGYDGRITVHPVAAGNDRRSSFLTTGTSVLNRVVDSATEAMDPKRVSETPPIARPTGVEAIEIVPLDDILSDRHAAVVKIDVEGFEREVLEGAVRMLSEHRAGYLQLENNDTASRPYERSSLAVWKLLRHYGYELYSIDLSGALASPRSPDPA